MIKETAEVFVIFSKIDYLDDDPNNKLAIDSCFNYKKYIDFYPVALPSLGNCMLHAEWIERLGDAGFILPKLIYPMTTISPSTLIEEGTIVEMKVIVGTNVHIKTGCIISSGAIIDVTAVAHVGCAATVRKGSVVLAFSVLQNCEVYV